MSLVPATSDLLFCDPSQSVLSPAAVQAYAKRRDAFGSTSDDEVAIEEVPCELANILAMGFGGFGGLGGARGVRKDNGVFAGEL